MTSKNWYFSMAKEDLKRRVWLIALTALILFFSFPVMAILYAGNIDRYANYQVGIQQFKERMNGLTGLQNGWIIFLIVLAAVIYGLSGFSYLNSKSKVDFYHSIPIRREKMFLVNFADGFVILSVLYAVFLGLAVIIGAANGAETAVLIKNAAAAYAVNISFFLLLYATVVTAVMMTGKLLVAILGTGVFFFYIPVLGMLMYSMYEMFLLTYSPKGTIMPWCFRFSPFLLYMMAVEAEACLKYAVIAAAAGVGITLIALWLYKKRPSEGAGKSLVFAVSKPVIRLAIVFCSGLGGASFGWSLRGNMGWTIFFLLCGAIISHCVIEIIYNADFKKLFCHPAQMAGCIIATIILVCGFRIDLLGYDRYLPKADSLSSVSINIQNLDGWLEYGHLKEVNQSHLDWEWVDRTEYIFDHMALGDMQPVLDIVSAGVNEAAIARKNMTYSRYGYGSWYREDAINEAEQYCWIVVKFTKPGGGTARRTYQIPQRLIEDQIELLYRQESFKTAMYPVLEQKDALAYVHYTKFNEAMDLWQGDPQKAEELRQAYCQDLMEQTIAARKTESPVAQIRFVTEEEDRLMRQYSNNYWSKENSLSLAAYPVYPSFRRTLACLSQAGINPEEWPAGLEILSGNLEIVSYQEEDYMTEPEGVYYDTAQRQYIYLSAGEVEELLPYVIYENDNMNSFENTEANVRLYISISKANPSSLASDSDSLADTLNFVFPADKLPDSIKKQLDNSL